MKNVPILIALFAIALLLAFAGPASACPVTDALQALVGGQCQQQAFTQFRYLVQPQVQQYVAPQRIIVQPQYQVQHIQRQQVQRVVVQQQVAPRLNINVQQNRGFLGLRRGNNVNVQVNP